MTVASSVAAQPAAYLLQWRLTEGEALEKRYQVFVSSTYDDLREERQEVMQALLELDCIPSGMELFPAADDDQWTLIQRVIDDCDYYIVIIGARYGSTGPSGKSYTEMEYEYAAAKGKPIIAFIHSDPGSISASRSEMSSEGRAHLEEFRKVVQRRLCRMWASPKELGSVVSRSIVKLIKDKPGVGWVRADRVADQVALEEIVALRRTIEELRTTAAERTVSDLLVNEPGDHLARDDDAVEVEFTAGEPDNPVRGSVSTTWNDLFSSLAIDLAKGLSEESLHERLSAFVKARVTENANTSPRVSHEGAVRIMMHFCALGLVARDKAREQFFFRNWGALRAYRVYWSLTQRGEQKMVSDGSVQRVEGRPTVIR